MYGSPFLHSIQLRKLYHKSYFWILATPLLIAASAVAFATASFTRGSNAAGRIYSGFSSSSLTSPAIAYAAATFISSLISDARTSRAPRKIPGKHSTLFTWFGKSERPVETTAAPAAFASSGKISGVGLAHAKMIGSLAMLRTISLQVFLSRD